jgi:hypothetical protein
MREAFAAMGFPAIEADAPSGVSGALKSLPRRIEPAGYSFERAA